MKETEIVDYARRLYEAHGDKAEREATYKELEAEENGDESGAKDWHRIRQAIMEMRR